MKKPLGYLFEREDRLREQFDEFRERIASLVGYHAEDGAVPVEKLQAVLDWYHGECRTGVSS